MANSITPRLGEPGFSTKHCDPSKVLKIKCNYANAVYAKFKAEKYGINTCCEYDLDALDIQNQLLDLGTLHDPDMCLPAETLIVIDCCLAPCGSVARMDLMITLPCLPPENATASMILCAPPNGAIGTMILV